MQKQSSYICFFSWPFIKVCAYIAFLWLHKTVLKHLLAKNNNNHLLFSMVSVGHEFKSGLAGWLWLRVPRGCSHMSGPQSSEGQVTHSYSSKLVEGLIPSTWASSQGSLGVLKATNAGHWALLLDCLPLPPQEPGHGHHSCPSPAWMDSMWSLPLIITSFRYAVQGGRVSLAEVGHVLTQCAYNQGGWESE